MKIQWMCVVSAALALACGGAQTEPVTPAGERASSPGEAAAADGGGVSYRGGDGLSCQTAIAIVGAAGESDGVAAEYAWIKSHYPGAQLKQQSLVDCSGAAADKMAIVTAEGADVVLFFDISRFFGKL
jgi:hypothetical protein